MVCPQCSHQNVIDAAFCDGCGAGLQLACTSCGETNRIAARFCDKCGQRLVAAPVGGRFASAKSYTPAHLISRILTSTAMQEGERKLITVLFADTKGSMEAIAELDPEEARKFFDPVLQAMMAAVHQYEGFVNQVMGDGIMALFGAPIAHEDHAMRACHAALNLQERIEHYAKETRSRGGPDVEVRVGVNTGEVVVRSVSSDLRGEYSAVGRTSHVAARLEQIARPKTILISESTFRAANGAVDVKPLGPVAVKGLEQPIPLYELLAARHGRQRFQTGVRSGRPSRFAGRDRELSTMRSALDRADRGQGQIVALVGDPGVGKSRLVDEFRCSLDSMGWVALHAGAVSYGAQTAYLPIVALLRGYFGLTATDSIDEVRQKVMLRLDAFGPDLADTVPAFLWLLDVAGLDRTWTALDAATRRQRTIAAIKRLLFQESQKHRLLIVFEDLHWIDNETQTVLDSLVELVPSARMLLLVTYRGGYQHPWSGRAYYMQVRVDPLPLDAVESVLVDLLGTDPSLRPLKKMLIERTDGNPFFLEETVRSLVESQALTGVPGQYRMSSPPETVDIPNSVHAVLAARIDRLMPEDKELLQTAAVIGKDLSILILQAVTADRPDGELDARLQRLLGADMLHEMNASPREFTFKHALTHEVAYSGLLQEQRQRLHAAALRAIEQVYPERLAEHVEALARHAMRGEVWDKAARYLRQAGNAAAIRSSYAAAGRSYRLAIEALDHLPKTADTIKVGIDLRFELHTAGSATGESAPSFELLEEIETRCKTLGDNTRLARVYGYFAMAFWWIAEYDEAIKAGARALELARAQKEPRLEAISLIALGWSYQSRAEFVPSADALAQILPIARRRPGHFRVFQGLPLLQVIALSWLAKGDVETGDIDRALGHAREAVRLSEEADHPWSRAAAYYGLGMVMIRLGNIIEAVAAFEHGAQVCETFEIMSWGTTLACALGYAYALRGDVDLGLPLLQKAVQRAASSGCLAQQSLRTAWLSEAWLIKGEVSRAEVLARDALGLARRYHERSAEAHILRLLGDIAMSRDAALAIECYTQSWAVARETSLRPLEDWCRAAIERIADRSDRPVRSFAR